MYIVLTNQWFPPESGWGGVGMYNHQAAHALRALGHQVTVVTSRTNSSIPAEQETDDIHIRRILVRDAYLVRRLPILGRYVRELLQLVYSWRVDQVIRKVHREHPIDVVEFADVNAEGFFYVRSAQTPVVVRCHTPTFVLARYYHRREMPFDTRITSRMEKDLICRAHALTAPSADMARVIANDCDIPIENISVIPNALGEREFSRRETEPRYQIGSPAQFSIVILHVGRLERVKGVGILTEAIPQVVRQCPHARFIFVGSDRPTEHSSSQRAELEMWLTHAGIQSRVEFLGALDQAKLADCYCSADICVVPTMLYESFSYTCAQAMAAGRPIVASHIGGIPETVEDGVTGVLVTPGNVDELAAAIVRLARDPNLRERMGRAGREKVARDFDPLKLAGRTVEVYEQAIVRFGKQRGAE